MTVANQLLLSAHRISGRNRRSFTAEELVVSAWKNYPETFGLRGTFNNKGLPKYPDSNRVFAEIMGSKPLRRRGLIEKVGRKTYRLTAAGLQAAIELSSDYSQGMKRRSLDRNLGDQIRRLLRARAVTKKHRGETSAITFLDACSFWGISPRSSAMALESRLAHVESVLKQMKEYAGTKEVSVGRQVNLSVNDIKGLLDLHAQMQSTFKEELDIIRKRTDER